MLMNDPGGSGSLGFSVILVDDAKNRGDIIHRIELGRSNYVLFHGGSKKQMV